MSQREPEIVDEVLAKVSEVWKANPDLRLGQLLMCAEGAQATNQIFNCEDSQMIEKLDEFNSSKKAQ